MNRRYDDAGTKGFGAGLMPNMEDLFNSDDEDDEEGGGFQPEKSFTEFTDRLNVKASGKKQSQASVAGSHDFTEARKQLVKRSKTSATKGDQT